MNVQKFFNKKLRNPKSAYGLGKLFSKTKPYSSRIGRRIKETPTLKKLLSIHKKVKSIENLLGGIGKLDAKIIGVQDKAEKDKKKEKKKEGKKSNKLFGGIIQRPKTGFLDAIRNFVTYTFLGWLFTFLQPHLDKMQFILPVIQTAFDVMIFILKNILGGIGNTLKAFYFVKDNLTGAVDKVKEAASGIQKTFDDTLVALQDVVNGTIEVVNSFIESTGEKFNKVETVDAGTIPPLPEVPKFDNNTSSFSAPPTQQPNTLPPGMSIQGAATGGRIDPSTPVTRGIQPEERRDFRPLFKPSIQEQKSEPGKDVGGIDKVKDLYKSSTSGSGFSLGFFTISPTNEKDGFLALNKVSRELKINKSDDFLGLGNFMGASVDVALGQKPDKRTYQQFASGINYLVNYGINNPEAFQKMNLERMIETMVNSKVDVAINKIREEINKRSTTETPGDGESAPPGGGGGGGTAGGEYGGYAPSGIQKEIYDYLINVKKLSDVQALGLLANINRESSFRPGVLITDINGKPSGGLFQWNGGRFEMMVKKVPDWKTNWRGQIDWALDEPWIPGRNGKAFISKKFSSAQEAADWWMNEWEVVRYPERDSKKHKKYLDNIPKAPDGSAKFREPESTETSNQNRVLTSGGIIPSQATITSTWQSKESFRRAPHTGIDYGYPVGTPISLIKDGEVVEASTGYNAGYGNFILVRHSDGTYSMFNHLDKIYVTRGQKIRASQGNAPVIGTIGNTGFSTGPHLDFKVATNWDGYSPSGFIDPRTHQDNVFRIGGNVKIKPSQVAKLAMKDGKEGIMEDGKWKLKPWTDEERARYNEVNPQRQSTPQQLTTQQKENIHNALMRKGQIPFNVGNESYYFVALADGSYRAYRNRNILGANVPEAIDITGSKNKPIQAAIRQTINKMYPLPSLSQPKPKESKKKKGGLVYEQNNNPLFPPQTYASYNEPQMMAKVFIQPVIVEAPKSSTPSGIMFPSINLNSSKSPKLIKQ